MFEQIVLRRSPTGSGLTAGDLAEALLFYENVHILMDFGCLGGLLKTIGPDLLCSLIEGGRLKASYYKNLLGTYTDTKNGVQTFRFEVFEWAGHAESGPKKRIEETLPLIFERVLGNSKETKKSARRFLDSVPIKSLSDDTGHPKGIIGAATEDLDDPNYLRRAVELAIQTRLPNFIMPAGWSFEVMRFQDYFVISTNLPFGEMNTLYQSRYGSTESPFNPAHLVDHILGARADLMLAVSNMAEFMTGSASSKIMELKFSNILSKRYRNAKEVELFQKIVVPSGRAIKEVIDSGERSFDDFTRVLDKASRFKFWLHKVHPDSELVRDYLSAVTKKTWVDTLPTKALRFAVTSTIGLAEPITGGIIGAADTFLLERFARGWRPDQFIENDLRSFVSSAPEK